MKRAILVALGTGTLISSAAALTLGNTSLPASEPAPQNEYERARFERSAREAHREAIEVRYRAARSRCDTLGGIRHDDCLIAAHAFRGSALMQAQAAYARN
jgi:hypothetical protein